MNQRKKWYLVLTVLVLITILIGACAPATTPTPTTIPATSAPTTATGGEKVVLKIMDNWGTQNDAKGPPLHSIFDDFMKAYPNITIQEEVFADTDIPTKVATAFLAGEEPDIVFQNYPYLSKDWLKDGVTIDVTDLIQKWGLLDNFKPEALAQYTDSEGRVVSFPLEGFTWPMWYNMKIFKAAGINEVPKTIDELIEDSKKIRAAGYQPLAIGGGDWSGQAFFNVINSTLMTNQEFGEVYANGDFSKNKNLVDSVDLFVKLRDEKVFVDNAEGLDVAAMTQMFYTGKAAMMHAGSWSFSEPPAEMTGDIVVAGFPLPPGSPWKKPIVPSGYVGKGVWITRNGAKKLDAVELFVKFFFQPQMIGRFVEQAGMVSPLKDTVVDETKLGPLFVQTLKWGDSVDYVDVVDPYIPVTAWEDLTNVTKEAFIPGTTVDKIIKDLDAAWLRNK